MNKSTVNVMVDEEVMKVLMKRAKRQMLTLNELCADILRRSALSTKEGTSNEKLDDQFLTYFSRKGGKKTPKSSTQPNKKSLYQNSFS